MRDQLNALNYRWNHWMINYKGESQEKLLQRLFGDNDSGARIFKILLSFFVLLALGFLSLLIGLNRSNGKTKISQAQQLLNYYGSVLDEKGIKVSHNPTMKILSKMAVIEYPQLKSDIMVLRFDFEHFLYSQENGFLESIDFKQFKRRIKNLYKNTKRQN